MKNTLPDSTDANTSQAGKLFMEIEKEKGSLGYPFITTAIFTEICNNLNARKKRASLVPESLIRKLFYTNLESYLPGAHKTKIDLIKGHVPDGFLRYNNLNYVVEIKKNQFNSRHLDQLLRYIMVYKIPRGIAVAQQLKCKPTNNIIFVGVDPGTCYSEG